MQCGELKSIIEWIGNVNVEIHFFPKNFLVFRFSDIIRTPGLVARGENAGLGPQCPQALGHVVFQEDCWGAVGLSSH